MSIGNGKCKEINQFVKVEYITKKIPDGNHTFDAGAKKLAIDCKMHNCKYYNGCKICQFDNIIDII